MTRLPADLSVVASANPVPLETVAGTRNGQAALELRTRLLSSTAGETAPLRRGRRRLIALALTALATVVVGTAIGARLLADTDVQRFLPQGSLVFAGAQPHCTATELGVAYRCVLAHTPTGMKVIGADGRPGFRGSKFGTVGDDGRVNGGCIALNDPGTQWACYLGQRAIDEDIIDPSVLGQSQSGPAGG